MQMGKENKPNLLDQGCDCAERSELDEEIVKRFTHSLPLARPPGLPIYVAVSLASSIRRLRSE
jgi:hypothetical protein